MPCPTVPHPIRRGARLVALTMALTALGAACASDDSTGPATVAGSENAVASTPTSTDASTTTAAASATTAPAGSATREVTDIHGPLTVPADPQRVVVMESESLGSLLAIGFPMDRVVGYPLTLGGSFANSPELAAIDPSSFESIGDFADPNLEAIAALEPDLIVTVGLIGDEFYDQQHESLQQLGVPVFTVLNGYQTFDDAMTMLADAGRAVNREAAAAEVEAGLRRRVQQLGAEVAARDLPATGYVRVNRQDNSIYVEASPWLTLLGVPGPRPSLEEYGVSYSPELLDEALGGYDQLIVAERIEGGDFVEALEGNPLWPQLPAVQAGAVDIVSENTWKAYSAPAISWILDDIERILLG